MRLWALWLAFLAAFFFMIPETFAQDDGMSFDLDEAEKEPAESAEGSEGEGTEADADAAEDGAAEDDDALIAELAAEEDTGPKKAVSTTRSTESVEEIYAVQQVYALRLNRLELLPSFAITINDPYVSHPALGIGLNYWFTNVLAVGANFLWYQGFETESDLNFFARRSTRVAIPINEWQLGTHVNFTYVPLYGKFSMFKKYIFQWDSYVVGGVGFMRTRPVPVIDPSARDFDYGLRLAFNVGIGIRVFVTRWLAIFTEMRNYMFLEKHENTEVALGEERFNPDTFLQDGSTFTNNVSFHFGASIFFPFTFEYRRPK